MNGRKAVYMLLNRGPDPKIATALWDLWLRGDSLFGVGWTLNQLPGMKQVFFPMPSYLGVDELERYLEDFADRCEIDSVEGLPYEYV